MLASPWALAVATVIVISYLVAGPRIGLPEQRIVLGFLLTLVTFVMVLILEHNGAHERDAIQVKLDELLRAVGDADSSKIGLEELHPDQIETVRESGPEVGRRTRHSSSAARLGAGEAISPRAPPRRAGAPRVAPVALGRSA